MEVQIGIYQGNLHFIAFCMTDPKTARIAPLTILQKGVEKLFKGLKQEKASGFDNIPNRVLKEFSNELSPAATALFTHTLGTGTVPEDWTDAAISLIFEKGDVHLVWIIESHTISPLAGCSSGSLPITNLRQFQNIFSSWIFFFFVGGGGGGGGGGGAGNCCHTSMPYSYHLLRKLTQHFTQ